MLPLQICLETDRKNWWMCFKCEIIIVDFFLILEGFVDFLHKDNDI